MDYMNEKFTDRKGNEYTRERTDELLPLAHYRLLAAKGLLPDTLKGKKLDIDEIRLNALNFRARPVYINPPQIPLYPLFESKPPRLKLEMPEEFFRITDRMEFINCESNEIVENLTTDFTKALQANDFVFPASRVYGNPTTRKAYDEGYFVFDKDENLFHIKKIEGKPFCKVVDVPDSIKIKTIFVREFSLKEFYAFIITENSDLYLLLFDNYQFKKMPVQNYNSNIDMFRFQGNIFYRTFAIYKENQLFVYVTNRDYELIDQYEESWLDNKQRTAGIMSAYFFPFELTLNSPDSQFIDFYFTDYNYTAIYLNVLLALIAFFIMRKNKIRFTTNILDYLIIMFTGLFGFIAVMIFKYED
jgi:hypothetical protein